MYVFMLKTEDGSEMQFFPANPETLEVSCGADHQKYSLMDIGEVIIPGHSLCKNISFSSWLMPSSGPRSIILSWERYMKERRVMRLIITGASPWGADRFEINLPVIFEKLKFTEKGGEPGTIFFDVVFKEYRSFSLKVIT